MKKINVLLVILLITSHQMRADFIVKNETPFLVRFSLGGLAGGRPPVGGRPRMRKRLTIALSRLKPNAIKTIKVPYGNNQLDNFMVGYYDTNKEGFDKIESNELFFSDNPEWIPNEHNYTSMATNTRFEIPNEIYEGLIRNSKNYLPIIRITHDQKSGEPVIHAPKDERELKEAIEIAKKETLRAATEKIHEGTQLPHKTGGLCRIAAEYFMESEEEPKKE